MKFTYPENSTELAMAAVKGLHADARLFYDETYDPAIQRFELSLPSMNYLLSGKYSGEGSGFAIGKLYNFFGMQSVGKSAMSLQIQGDILKAGGKCLWEDIERSFDPDYTKRTFGIDVNNPNFIVSIPDTAEEVFDICENWARMQAASCAVLDSVTAMSPKAENDAKSGKVFVGGLARAINPHFTKIVKLANDNLMSIIYINQLRDNLINIGGMLKSIGKKFSGGNAMLFYPHVSLEFKKDEDFYINKEEKTGFIGSNIKITAYKNKIAPMQNKSIYLLMLSDGRGFSREMDIFNLATDNGVIRKSGSHYYLGERKIANGFKAVFETLQHDSALVDEIWDLTKPLLDNPIARPTEPQPEQADGEEEFRKKPSKSKLKMKKVS